MLASEWKRIFVAFHGAGPSVSPVLLVVCDNTNLAKLVHDHTAKANALTELKNQDRKPEGIFPYLVISPAQAPTEVTVEPAVVYRI
jgi:type III restriction enzyme